MRTHTVVFLAKIVQPVLSFAVPGRAPAQQSRGQAAMKPFHLALGLRMLVSAEAQADILIHQPNRKLTPAHSTLGVEPGRAVIHQHLVRHSALAENPLQYCLYAARRPPSSMPATPPA